MLICLLRYLFALELRMLDSVVRQALHLGRCPRNADAAAPPAPRAATSTALLADGRWAYATEEEDVQNLSFGFCGGRVGVQNISFGLSGVSFWHRGDHFGDPELEKRARSRKGGKT